MPPANTKRKQLNVLLPDEGHARLATLVERVRSVVGIDASQADVIGAALVAFEEKLHAMGSATPFPTSKAEAKPETSGEKPVKKRGKRGGQS
jgi:hypothetical protein